MKFVLEKLDVSEMDVQGLVISILMGMVEV